jgi:hypothetical protein
VENVYLTSFVHREELFRIAERWLCGRLELQDARRITEILICDGFVLGETLEGVANVLLRMVHERPIRTRRIESKGELRDALCSGPWYRTPRVDELVRLYKDNPDFFYRETPINGVMCMDDDDRLVGLFRVKRPRRIAEKANRYIANWIFQMVQAQAQIMAAERARRIGISIDRLLTPKEEMAREFIQSEEAIARGFRNGAVRLDRAAVTIHDVGGIKIVADSKKLRDLEQTLSEQPIIRVVDKENYRGDYRASSLILEVPWDHEQVCRKFTDCQCWERYLRRGIPAEELKRGLEPLLRGADATIHIELILSTFPDMVESELGASIHEERILAQRDHRVYRGYIPTNVEFLVEFLFALGFSPTAQVDQLPIKLWGRYLPDTVISHIRALYGIPELGVFC